MQVTGKIRKGAKKTMVPEGTKLNKLLKTNNKWYTLEFRYRPCHGRALKHILITRHPEYFDGMDVYTDTQTDKPKT